MTSDLSLDPSRLERLRHSGTRMIARCPACSEQEHDRSGAHLVIFPSGKFACAAHPGDRDHRRRIFELVGIRRKLSLPQDLASLRARREEYSREQAKFRDRQQLQEDAREELRAILARHSWDFADVWHDSPQIPDGELVESDPRHFLATLFPPEALLWTGAVYQSGGTHAARWQSCATWQQVPKNEVGPLVTPAHWQPATDSRCASAVIAAPYTVLDFDGFGGVKPITAEQKQAHLRDSLAMIRWIREDLGWKLAAILWTGGKSLHAWFHTPPPEVLESLALTATELGIDAGLIGRPEHPCRLPGWRHAGTGQWSRVLWLELGRLTRSQQQSQ
ncbi:hypothetical protein [Haloferula sp. BvORR071]|uniref:hypothetical protein n=1 Tax=Haloferula sp. BvORR071 TaxID=1396141 RepID=UPI00054FF10B|nr:hypothetical protein [Haloferula sp. BvORR071]